MTATELTNLELSAEEINQNIEGVLAKISVERLNDYSNYKIMNNVKVTDA